MDYLRKNTRYDEQEIREWYKGFKVDCPDGTLSKGKILDMYSMILPAGNAQVFVDQIFRIFDKDGNGTIDFKVRLLEGSFLLKILRLVRKKKLIDFSVFTDIV